MKQYVSLVLIILFSCTPSKKTISTREHENYIEFYSLLDAYNKVGKASVKFGADTESEWAAGQIDSICNALKAKDFSFNEYMTCISLIRSLIAYSISYVPGTFGMYRDADLGRMAWDIPYESKIVFTNIRQNITHGTFKLFIKTFLCPLFIRLVNAENIHHNGINMELYFILKITVPEQSIAIKTTRYFNTDSNLIFISRHPISL